MEKINYKDIEEILGFEVDSDLKERIEKYDLKYRKLNDQERDQFILDNINVLTNEITVSGKHRITEWEIGWDENLNLFKKTGNIDDLIPKYHGKNRIVRWKGEVVMPLVENFDYKIHICFVDAIIRHYLNDVKNIFEMGCGPAYHLLRYFNFDKTKNLFGTDWAESSQKIIEEININFGTSINPINLDFFNIDKTIDIPENSGVYTVASLEQIGDRYKDIIDFIIEKKVNVCIHMEPIDELLDTNKLIDSLSIKYFRKRNYLNGLLPYLESLEKENKIKIIKKQRIFSGSYFIEGHSLIVWKPL